MTKNKSRTLKTSVEAKETIITNSGGTLNHYLVQQIEDTYQFDEFAALFQEFKIHSVELRFIPYDPTKTGNHVQLHQRSDGAAEAYTYSGSFVDEKHLNLGGRILSNFRGSTFTISINSDWEEFDDAQGNAEDMQARNIISYFVSDITYPSSTILGHLILKWNVSMKYRDFY